MTEITPEMLKEIAEAMGKNLIETTWDEEFDRWTPYVMEYHPHTCWNQCGELLEWLIDEGLSVEVFAEPYDNSRKVCQLVRIIGDVDLWETVQLSHDVMTAIVLAAYDYIKSKQNG